MRRVMNEFLVEWERTMTLSKYFFEFPPLFWPSWEQPDGEGAATQPLVSEDTEARV